MVDDTYVEDRGDECDADDVADSRRDRRAVVTDARAVDPFDGLTRIGIDQLLYRRGHKYLMVVVDHDTDSLVWAKAGHDRQADASRSTTTS